jgi:crossover junction endodeoxyribonuclease RuvC
MRVLAIDPGYKRLGIAVLEKNERNEEQLIFSDCFKTDSKLNFEQRLKLIGEKIEECITTHQPTHFAIEKLYFNSNQKTAMQVAEARGALLYIASSKRLPIYEYTPLQIKIAIVGYGRGEKKQVISMVKKLIRINKEIQYDDEFDAIAVGLTCLASEH